MKNDLTQIKDILKVQTGILSRHTKILDGHTRTLGEHTKTLNEHTEELKKHTEILDRHTKKLLDHDAELCYIRDNMATKDDFRLLLDGQDKLITLFKNLDQERWFTVSWLRRVEGRVDAHDTKIKGIKKQITKT